MAYTGKINASNANITFRNIKKASNIANNSFNTPNISPGGGYGELAIDIGDALIKYGTIDDVTLTFNCHSNRGDCVVRAGYITSGNSGGYSWQKTVEGISRSSSSPTSFSHTFKPTRSSDGLYHLVIGTRNLNTILLATVNVYTITIAINYTPKQISYSFVNWDGSSLKTGTVDYGATPTAPENPSRASTAQYNYTFSGWSPSVGAITGNTTYTAQFTQTLRNYAVTFKDENGATLKTETVNYGSTVTAPSDPVKADTAQHKYTFDGWYDANGNKWYPNTAITGDTVYTARYTAEVQRYTVKWYNEDGSELLETDESVPYGTMPTYDGATPTKAETEENTYEHIGWSIDVNSSETTDLSAVVESVSYYARFRAISKGYTVIWKNEDGTVLETDTVVPFGTQPDYNGATPEKASDVQYDYTFLGWSAKVEDPPLDDSQLPTVTGNITYTAVYTKTLKLYPIKVILFDTEYTSVVEYGSDIVLEAPEVIGYKFTQWNDGNTDNPRTVEVTGEATYQAVYERIPFPIMVNNEQVTGVYIVPSTQTIVYVISGEVPVVEANEVTVDGWSFEVSNSVPNNSYLLEKLYINETRVY